MWEPLQATDWLTTACRSFVVDAPDAPQEGAQGTLLV